MRAGLLLLAAVGLVGCVDTEDEPSNVHDLRVLGVQLSPPEILAESCPNGLIQAPQLQAFSAPIQYRALIADPLGGGRTLHYRISACDGPTNDACEEKYAKVLLVEGDIAPPEGQGFVELQLSLSPGALVGPSGEPFLLSVQKNDPYLGLAGVRMALLLELTTAGAERIRAEKLMIFSCWFPQPAANQNPSLPGLTLQGSEWAEGAMPTVSIGAGGELEMAAMDYDARQERYQAPRTDGQPVQLTESWRLSWYTEDGTLSPEVTGGTDAFSGQEGRASTRWEPARSGERDVRFYVVARDGRGGLSWLIRTLHVAP